MGAYDNIPYMWSVEELFNICSLMFLHFARSASCAMMGIFCECPHCVIYSLRRFGYFLPNLKL